MKEADIPISLVVAVGENGVIGANGGLPWRLRADLKRFRAVTMGNPMVMGRSTFESIGKILDGRDSIVITRREGLGADGVFVAHDVAGALEIARERAEANGSREITVIGGGGVFADTLPLADRLHVTHIAAAPEGDTFFPPVAPADWAEMSREELPSAEGDTVRGTYVVYERRKPGRG